MNSFLSDTTHVVLFTPTFNRHVSMGRLKSEYSKAMSEISYKKEKTIQSTRERPCSINPTEKYFPKYRRKRKKNLN